MSEPVDSDAAVPDPACPARAAGLPPGVTGPRPPRAAGPIAGLLPPANPVQISGHCKVLGRATLNGRVDDLMWRLGEFPTSRAVARVRSKISALELIQPDVCGQILAHPNVEVGLEVASSPGRQERAARCCDAAWDKGFELTRLASTRSGSARLRSCEPSALKIGSAEYCAT